MTDPTETTALVEAFVARFEGNPIVALRAIEDHHGIAVHYQDRASMETALGREFTAAEWTRVREHLPTYHDWLLNSGAGDSIAYWRDLVLDNAKVDTHEPMPHEPRPRPQSGRSEGSVEHISLTGEVL